MAQQFGALAAFWFPVPTWQHTTACNSSLSRSDALFWPMKALHACSTLKYMQAKYLQKIKKNP